MRSIKVRVAVVVTVAVCVVVGFSATGASALAAHDGRTPNLGPNVIVLSPSMPRRDPGELDAISTQQVGNQFGSQRYAILFEPGTYGSAVDPLIFQVGYYTQVAGLVKTRRRGHQWGDRRVQRVRRHRTRRPKLLAVALGPDAQRRAAQSPRRPTPPRRPNRRGAQYQQEFWAVSQAAPMRRVIMNGNICPVQDYCDYGVRQRRLLRRRRVQTAP